MTGFATRVVDASGKQDTSQHGFGVSHGPYVIESISSSPAKMVAAQLAGPTHVDRAHRVCLSCNSGALGDEKHLVFECPALASLRQRHAGLFTSQTDTMRSFFAQQDHLGVFHYVIDCLDFMQI